MEVIKTEKLTKYYGKSRGIIDLDLAVNQGDFFGFIGPNGAGKSTTIRTLLGLIKPTSGTATIFNKDIVKEKEEILKEVGYIASEAIFYQGMRVKELLKLAENLHKVDCSKERELLSKRLDLDLNKKIDELSFGNRKKVAIVAALQHNPKLLILDEPTSGLDPLIQKEFFEILKERNKQGVTILLSSHILSEVQHYCSKAAIIREGKIIICDNVDNLAKSNAKRVNITGQVDLEKLDNIKDLSIKDKQTSFLYSGEINSLLKVLSENNIKDITISEPDLEEIFMHYYQKDGE